MLDVIDKLLPFSSCIIYSQHNTFQNCPG